MRKLLSAQFSRLWKNRAFWIGMLFMAGLGVFLTLNQYWEGQKYDFEPNLGMLLLSWVSMIGVVAAAFCGLFLGTEYSDGTVRNKLMVGHVRGATYLSNLVVCAAAVLLMALAYVLVVCVLGIPLLGGYTGDVQALLLQLGLSALMTAATTALMTAVAMGNQNRAAAAVICLLLIFALLFGAILLMSTLSAPEMFEGYVRVDEAGNFVQAPPEPNPSYVRGTKRAVYTFLLDFLPTGQMLQIMSGGMAHQWQAALYSLGVTLAATGAGMACFRKKDIK